MGQDHEDYADRDLPPPLRIGGCLIVVATALLTFVGGIVVTFLIERSIPPKVPNPTEVYEGFGDFADALIRLILGAIASLVAAVLAGLIAAGLLAAQSSRRQHGPPAG